MDTASVNGETEEKRSTEESKERPKSLDLEALPSPASAHSSLISNNDKRESESGVSRKGSSSLEDLSSSATAELDSLSLESQELEDVEQRSASRSRSIADSLKSKIRDLSPSRRTPSPKPDRKGPKRKSPSKSPKSPAGWLPASFNQMFSSYKSRSGDFRRLFKNLPDSEQLIVDYSCALQRDILVHGRLYVSQNWLCFYANIFGWETFVTVKCIDINSIKKEKTAFVIPNAVQICTESEKYFFASFISRDTAFTVLFRIWQNALLDQPLSPGELIQMVGKYADPRLEGSSEESDNDKDSQLSSGDITEDEDEDDEEEETRQLCVSDDQLSGKDAESNSAFMPVEIDRLASAPELSITPPSPTKLDELPHGDSIGIKKVSPNHTPKIEHKRSPLLVKKEVATHTSSRSTKKRDKKKLLVNEMVLGRNHRKESSDMDEEGTASECHEDEGAKESHACKCEKHLAINMLDEEYPVGVDIMYELLFTESDFYKKLQKHRKTRELIFNPWTKTDDGQRRVITYTIALNYSIGPKSSPTTELQHCFKGSVPGKVYVVEAEVNNEGIPYGESFSVLNRYCITQCTDKACRLRITSEIKYKKSVWGFVKNMIEKNASDGLREYFSFLGANMRKETDSGKKITRRRRSSPTRRHKRTRSLKSRDEIFISPPSTTSLEDKPSAEEPAWRSSLSRLISVKFSVPPMRIENKFALAVTVLLVCLLALNVFLMYRLLALEKATQMRYDWAYDIDKLPSDAKEWAKLLQGQKLIHDAEMIRWREILSTSIDLMNQVQRSLNELQTELRSTEKQ